MAQEFHLIYKAFPTQLNAQHVTINVLFWDVQQSYATESSLQGCHAVSLGKWFLKFRKTILNQMIALRPKRVKISRYNLLKTQENNKERVK